MTRGEQREVLEVVSRSLDRERHNLVAADLDRYPQLVFQQLYNRLQWKGGPVEHSVRPFFVKGSTPSAPPWPHQITRLRESEALIRTFAGHTGVVTACAFSPDGATIVSASNDRTLKLWDARSGAEVFSFPASGGLDACAFSPSDNRVCCGDAGGTVYVLELKGAWPVRHAEPGTLSPAP